MKRYDIYPHRGGGNPPHWIQPTAAPTASTRVYSGAGRQRVRRGACAHAGKGLAAIRTGGFVCEWGSEQVADEKKLNCGGVTARHFISVKDFY